MASDNAPIPKRKVQDNFMRREPFGKDWEPVVDPDTDPIVIAMKAVDTNYLQYTLTNAPMGKRGQVRYFRERVYDGG